MNWKDWVIIVCSLIVGFAIGYLVDFPQEVTFDATPELVEIADEMKDDLVRISELSLNRSTEECPVALKECRRSIDNLNCKWRD